LLIIVITFNFSVMVRAQTDSTSTTTYEESVQASDFNKRERFKYLRRSMIDEPSMFKISALPYWSGYYGVGATVVTGYERKLTKSFSVTGELVNYINLFKPKNYSSEIQYKGFWRTGLNASVRYYYSQKKQIREGSSGNNLLSNYLEFKVDDILTYGRVVKSGKVETAVSSYPNLILAWGVQRRIRKLGYFDDSVGVKLLNSSIGYNNPVMPYAKIALGLGFSKKNK
jgi:hypothetical protein